MYSIADTAGRALCLYTHVISHQVQGSKSKGLRTFDETKNDALYLIYSIDDF